MNRFESTDIPKVFWKYFDLYRRKLITMEQFSKQTQIPIEEIKQHLSIIQ